MILNDHDLGQCRRFFRFSFDVGDTECINVEFHEDYYANGGEWTVVIVIEADRHTARLPHLGMDRLPYGVMPDSGLAEQVAANWLKYNPIQTGKEKE